MPCELSQLGLRLFGVFERFGQHVDSVGVPALHGATRQLERKDRVDEARLCPVVQIAAHSPALLISGGHDPGARCRKLGAARLDQPVRVAQLGIREPPVGHVRATAKTTPRSGTTREFD